MGVKPDHWIVTMAHEHGMIEPFEESQVSQGTISYGVSSYGYDMRLDREFLVFQGGEGNLVDPKCSGELPFEEMEGDDCIIPAGNFVLAKSLEYFRIPRSVLTICTGKSTYARCGLIVNVTPFEPRVGRLCHHVHLQHEPVSREGLCRRRDCPGCVSGG